MFISPAYAQAAGGGGMDSFGMFLPLILIFVVFYFLLWRPQQKKAKDHRELLTSLKRGDRIVTTGGLIGTITRVIGEAELALEIADGVKVRVMRGMVADRLAEGKRRARAVEEEDEAEEDEVEEDDFESDDEKDEEQAR